MSTEKYYFISPSSSNIYEEHALEPIKFYQFCAFADPKTTKYEVKVFYVNGYNEITNYKQYFLDKKIRKKLLRSLTENKYRMFPVYNLDYIDYPSSNDISFARSAILNTETDISNLGYAPFN